jgi:hypothetical protein
VNSVKTSDGQIDIGATGITIKATDGTVTTIGGGALPEGWPKSTIELIPGATISSGTKTSNDKGDVFSLIFTSTKKFSEVNDYYKAAANSFTEPSTYSAAEMSSFGGKKDGFDIYIIITGTDGDVSGSITLSKY